MMKKNKKMLKKTNANVKLHSLFWTCHIDLCFNMLQILEGQGKYAWQEIVNRTHSKYKLWNRKTFHDFQKHKSNTLFTKNSKPIPKIMALKSNFCEKT